jgi:hypothetical protein
MKKIGFIVLSGVCALQHCISIVSGEGEPLWPEVLDDFDSGTLKPRYVQSNSDTVEQQSERLLQV